MGAQNFGKAMARQIAASMVGPRPQAGAKHGYTTTVLSARQSIVADFMRLTDKKRREIAQKVGCWHDSWDDLDEPQRYRKVVFSVFAENPEKEERITRFVDLVRRAAPTHARPTLIGQGGRS